MAPPDRTDVPSAVYVMCPDCSEESLHTVLKGTVGTKGGYTLDATVSCAECGRVHQAQVREPPPRELPVIVSAGNASRRTRVTLGGDEEVKEGDLLIVDDRNVMVTAVETPEGRRPEMAKVSDIATIWAKDFEEVAVKFAINLGHKTITKQVPGKPEDQVFVGDEAVFGRLRVTVHAIKTTEKLLRRGGASAKEIVRVFAKPTRPDRKAYRPEKPIRDRQREAVEERGGRGGGGAAAPRPASARFGARKARARRDYRAQRGGEEEDEEF